MALSLKERKIASSFRQKLEQLQCPYVDGVDDSWIIELVYRPGEPRIRLLQWLFSKFSPKLAEIMDPQFPMTDTKMDSRIQKLLLVASSMSLCCAEDADLIRGTCPISKQTVFMKQLLEIMCIMDTSQDPMTKAMHSPGHVSGLSVDEQYHHDCHLLDTLASGGGQYNMERMYSTEPKLLPPDILRHLATVNQQQGEGGVPELSALMTKAEQLVIDLDRQQKQLASLRDAHPGGSGTPDTAHVRRVHCTVRVVLTELHQMLTGFSTCFETEMRPWSHREPPKLSQLGPACKRVHILLTHFTQVLSELNKIQSNYRTLCEDVQDSMKKITQQNQKGGRVDLKPFQECVDVLEESMVRLDNTFDSSMRSGLTISTITPSTGD